MIHHVGIVAERPADAWIGLAAIEPVALVASGFVPEFECRCFVFRVGDGETLLEIVVPTGGKLLQWLKERGTSLHHIAIRVSDVRAAGDQYLALGAKLISNEPVRGVNGWLVNFVHPSFCGLLIELVQE